MSSSINYNSINENFPVSDKNNSSQGFRDNFTAIKSALQEAANEINGLQNSVNVTFTQNATNATTRTLQDKLSDVLSVKDFGAVGDGITDDSNAIQNALNYCLTKTYSALYFPTGTYLLNEPITGTLYQTLTTNIPQRLVLFGDGPLNSVLLGNNIYGAILLNFTCITDDKINFIPSVDWNSSVFVNKLKFEPILDGAGTGFQYSFKSSYNFTAIGSISGTTLTITSLTGTISNGNIILGGNIIDGTYIVQKLSANTYTVSISQTITSTIISSLTIQSLNSTNAGLGSNRTLTMTDCHFGSVDRGNFNKNNWNLPIDVTGTKRPLLSDVVYHWGGASTTIQKAFIDISNSYGMNIENCDFNGNSYIGVKDISEGVNEGGWIKNTSMVGGIVPLFIYRGLFSRGDTYWVTDCDMNGIGANIVSNGVTELWVNKTDFLNRENTSSSNNNKVFHDILVNGVGATFIANNCTIQGNILNIGDVVSGVVIKGQVLSGIGVTNLTIITDYISGSGDSGTYLVNNSQITTTTTITGIGGKPTVQILLYDNAFSTGTFNWVSRRHLTLNTNNNNSHITDVRFRNTAINSRTIKPPFYIDSNCKNVVINLPEFYGTYYGTSYPTMSGNPANINNTFITKNYTGISFNVSNARINNNSSFITALDTTVLPIGTGYTTNTYYSIPLTVTGSTYTIQPVATITVNSSGQVSDVQLTNTGSGFITTSGVSLSCDNSLIGNGTGFSIPLKIISSSTGFTLNIDSNSTLSGTILPGMLISGTGTDATTSNSVIINAMINPYGFGNSTGTGGIGTYSINIKAFLTNVSLTGSCAFKINTLVNGVVEKSQLLLGDGIDSGTTIISNYIDNSNNTYWISNYIPSNYSTFTFPTTLCGMTTTNYTKNSYINNISPGNILTNNMTVGTLSVNDLIFGNNTQNGTFIYKNISGNTFEADCLNPIGNSGRLNCSITGNILTVISNGGQPLMVGQMLIGGGKIIPNTFIMSQLTNTGSAIGNEGTYQLNNTYTGTITGYFKGYTLNYNSQNIFPNTTIVSGSITGSTLTVNSISSGVVSIGSIITIISGGTNTLPNNVVIIYQIPNVGVVGGVGKYILNTTLNSNISATTITIFKYPQISITPTCNSTGSISGNILSVDSNTNILSISNNIITDNITNGQIVIGYNIPYGTHIISNNSNSLTNINSATTCIISNTCEIATGTPLFFITPDFTTTGTIDNGSGDGLTYGNILTLSSNTNVQINQLLFGNGLSNGTYITCKLGIYTNVTLIVTGATVVSNPIATITVANNSIIKVVLTYGGSGFTTTSGVSLSCNNIDVGGAGSGFSVPITGLYQTGVSSLGTIIGGTGYNLGTNIVWTVNNPNKISPSTILGKLANSILINSTINNGNVGSHMSVSNITGTLHTGDLLYGIGISPATTIIDGSGNDWVISKSHSISSSINIFGLKVKKISGVIIAGDLLIDASIHSGLALGQLLFSDDLYLGTYILNSKIVGNTWTLNNRIYTDNTTIYSLTPDFVANVKISGNTMTIYTSMTNSITIGQVIIGSNILPGTYITGGSGNTWTLNNSYNIDTYSDSNASNPYGTSIITVSSTNNLQLGMKVVVSSGIGSFNTDTVVVNIINTTQFEVSLPPVINLLNATITGYYTIYGVSPTFKASGTIGLGSSSSGNYLYSNWINGSISNNHLLFGANIPLGTHIINDAGDTSRFSYEISKMLNISNETIYMAMASFKATNCSVSSFAASNCSLFNYNFTNGSITGNILTLGADSNATGTILLGSTYNAYDSSSNLITTGNIRWFLGNNIRAALFTTSTNSGNTWNVSENITTTTQSIKMFGFPTTFSATSCSITSSSTSQHSVLTIGGTISGTLTAGDLIIGSQYLTFGTSIPVFGSNINISGTTNNATGTGGAGTYVMNNDIGITTLVNFPLVKISPDLILSSTSGVIISGYTLILPIGTTLPSGFGINTLIMISDAGFGFSISGAGIYITGGSGLIWQINSPMMIQNETLYFFIPTYTSIPSTTLNNVSISSASGSTFTVADTTGIYLGMVVTKNTGSGSIPNNTTITGINTGTKVITISKNMTGTISSVNILGNSTTIQNGVMNNSGSIITGTMTTNMVLVEAIDSGGIGSYTLTNNSTDTLSSINILSANTTLTIGNITSGGIVNNQTILNSSNLDTQLSPDTYITSILNSYTYYVNNIQNIKNISINGDGGLLTIGNIEDGTIQTGQILISENLTKGTYITGDNGNGTYNINTINNINNITIYGFNKSKMYDIMQPTSNIIIKDESQTIYSDTTIGRFTGYGNPNGLISAPIGSYYTDMTGGSNSTLYIKENNTISNQGWVAK